MCVLYALIGLLLLIVIILSIPFDIVFYFNTAESKKSRLHFYWLFGLVHFNAGKSREKSVQKPAEAKKKKPGKQFKPQIILDIISIKGFLRQVFKLIKRIFRSFSIKKLTVNLTLGPEDPAQYAYLYSILFPVNYLLKKIPHNIQVNPVFEGQYIFEFISEGQIRILPVKSVYAVLAFVFSIPFIKALWVMIRKWK